MGALEEAGARVEVLALAPVARAVPEHRPRDLAESRESTARSRAGSLASGHLAPPRPPHPGVPLHVARGGHAPAGDDAAGRARGSVLQHAGLGRSRRRQAPDGDLRVPRSASDGGARRGPTGRALCRDRRPPRPVGPAYLCPPLPAFSRRRRPGTGRGLRRVQRDEIRGRPTRSRRTAGDSRPRRVPGFRQDVDAELAELDLLVHASVLPDPLPAVVLGGMAAGVLTILADAGSGRACGRHRGARCGRHERLVHRPSQRCDRRAPANAQRGSCAPGGDGRRGPPLDGGLRLGADRRPLRGRSTQSLLPDTTCRGSKPMAL